MPDRAIRDEVLTLLVAGHETTANVLAWTFYLLSTHPFAFRRLRDEALAVGDLATQWPRLSFTGMVLDEAMRLYPPGWVLVRQAVEPVVLEGYTLPAGSVVAVCPYLLHRDPRYWVNPQGFDPDRFDASLFGGYPRFAYLPFSAGARSCVGRAFARMEMQIIVASIARRYALDLIPTHPVAIDAQLTLRARQGIVVTLREPAAPSDAAGAAAS
jgi:cytochrome P450